MTVPHCLSWAAHLTRTALALARPRDGRRMAIRTAMMATTTRSSMSVNPRRRIGDPPKKAAIQVRHRKGGFCECDTREGEIVAEANSTTPRDDTVIYYI